MERRPVTAEVESSSLFRVAAVFTANLIFFLLWDLSSAGRASALQAEGHRFEPYSGSFFALKNRCERRGRGKKRQEKNEQGQRKETRLHGQAVKTPPFHGGNRGSNPLGVTEKIK